MRSEMRDPHTVLAGFVPSIEGAVTHGLQWGLLPHTQLVPSLGPTTTQLVPRHTTPPHTVHTTRTGLLTKHIQPIFALRL